MNDFPTIIADEVKLRAVLAERGLPNKLNVNLNHVEWKLHTVLVNAYNFRNGLVEAEIPTDVIQKCGKSFNTIWQIKPVGENVKGKRKYLFRLTEVAVKTTIKTVLNKDEGIFKATINKVEISGQWAKYLKPKTSGKTSVDWSEAERQAKRYNEHVKEQILDGKTFNAQKDNPWARKNLKNRNQ